MLLDPNRRAPFGRPREDYSIVDNFEGEKGYSDVDMVEVRSLNIPQKIKCAQLNRRLPFGRPREDYNPIRVFG
jgi:hypothetical protein